MGIFIGLFIAVPLLALIPASIAKGKGRSFWKWWWYGLWLWIIATPHACVMNSESDKDMKKCPSCAEYVKKEALKCKHCGEVFKTEAELRLKCPRCKESYDKTWKVCIHCNLPLEGTQS